jgi:hypothetical protein
MDHELNLRRWGEEAADRLYGEAGDKEDGGGPIGAAMRHRDEPCGRQSQRTGAIGTQGTGVRSYRSATTGGRDRARVQGASWLHLARRARWRGGRGGTESTHR